MGYFDLNNCFFIFVSEILVVDNLVVVFLIIVINGCLLLIVQFNNESEGLGEFNYLWNFFDGFFVFIEDNFVYVFIVLGNYLVELIVMDQDSCFVDIVVFNIFVFFDFVVDFSMDVISYCYCYDEVCFMNNFQGVELFEW